MSSFAFSRKERSFITSGTFASASISIFFFILAWASANQNGFVDFWYIPVSVISLVVSVYLFRKIFTKTSIKTRERFGRQPIVIGGFIGLILFFVLIVQLQLMNEGLNKIPLDPGLMTLIGLFFAFLSIASFISNFSAKTHHSLYKMDIIGAKKFVARLSRHRRK